MSIMSMELYRLPDAFVDHAEISNDKTANDTTATASTTMNLFKCLFPCLFFHNDDDDSDCCSSVGYMGSDEASCSGSSLCDTDDELSLYGESVRLEPNEIYTPTNSPEQAIHVGGGCAIDSLLFTPRISNVFESQSLVRTANENPSLAHSKRTNTLSKEHAIRSEKVSIPSFRPSAIPPSVKSPPALQLLDKRDDDDSGNDGDYDETPLLDKIPYDRQRIGRRLRTESDPSFVVSSFPSLSFSSDDDPLAGATIARTLSHEGERVTARNHRNQTSLRRVPPDWMSPNACFYNQGNPAVTRPSNATTSSNRLRRRRQRAPSLTSPNACFYNQTMPREWPEQVKVVRQKRGTEALCRSLI